MTTQQQAPPSAPHRNARYAWKMSGHGIWLVASLELRQRVRSTKWIWVLVAFAALVGFVTMLTAANMNGQDDTDTVFGLIVFFVLFLGLLVSPTLAATSVNGDNKEGTLAPLQATALSAADIVIGKLLGAWIASLAFVVVSIPFIAYAMAISNSHVGALFTTVGVLAVELLVVCAFGLGWSAITARPSASAVLSYVTVATLSILTAVFFGLTALLVTTKEPVDIYGSGYLWEQDLVSINGSVEAAQNVVQPTWDDSAYDEPACTWYVAKREQFHSERTWWLLALNPFVIVSDAAPVAERDQNSYGFSILGEIKNGVRVARLGPESKLDECWQARGDYGEGPSARDLQIASLGPVWPFGLGAHLLLAAGAIALAVRRVAVPHGTLASGTRVA